jgi:hypothetical protein
MRISFYKITIRITLFFNKEYWILVMETKNCATTNDDDIAYLAYLRRQELDKQARIEELAQKAHKEMQEKRKKQKEEEDKLS